MTEEQIKRLSDLTGVPQDQILAKLAQHEVDAREQWLGLQKAYAALGIAVTMPAPSPWGETMVCAAHDGVPYCLDAHGKPEKLMHGVRHRSLIIERHHALVKAVYEYCLAHAPGPIWALSGGGAQMQVFFGNSTGYLAILYLSLEDGSTSDVQDEMLELVGDKQFTLQVNWAKNDKLFEGFDVPGVTLRTHEETYGA